MTHVLAGIVVVTAMVAPYVVAAALTAAFPRLRCRIGRVPRTDQMVARFFDGSTPGGGRMHDDTDEVWTWFEDHRSWAAARPVGKRR
jgi:hypothetical protein